MTVGTTTSPLQSVEMMNVADRLVRDRFTGEYGRTLWEWRASLWEWHAGKWERRDGEWLLDVVMAELKDALVEKVNPETMVSSVVRLKPTLSFMRDVVRGVESLCRLRVESVPFWTGRTTSPTLDPSKCISFEDRVVDVGASAMASGSYVTFERDERWFDPVVIPAEWDPEATCPRWDRCQVEWGGDDVQWARLHRQAFGYGQMAWRGRERGFLKYGVIRAGKGTSGKMSRHLLGVGYMGTSMGDVGGTHGLDGCQYARVMEISESNDLDSAGGESFVRVWKNFVGRDPVTVNPKYERQLHSIILGAFPVISSNKIPKLPNDGQGVLGKLLVLPFNKSYLGVEQIDLFEELVRETPGIGKWVVDGAIEVVAGRPWAVPVEATDVVRRYRAQNNPAESFLEGRFHRMEGGFVRGDDLVRELASWIAATDVRLHVPRNQLYDWLIEGSSWGLYRTRNSRDERGLGGLVLTSAPEDVL